MEHDCGPVPAEIDPYSVPVAGINVEVIPHQQQRYDTLGDWWYRLYYDLALDDYRTVLEVRVSDIPGAEGAYSQAVAVHEITEALLCRLHGVAEQAVMDFDLANGDSPEPGQEPDAPYNAEHAAGDIVERVLIQQAGEKWQDYLNAIDTMPDWAPAQQAQVEVWDLLTADGERLAERLREGLPKDHSDVCICVRCEDYKLALKEAADALDRLSALESAASQREKNVAYVAFCIKSALDNGEKPVQDATLENWRDYLEGRANAPGPDETWSDVAQPNDAKKSGRQYHRQR